MQRFPRNALRLAAVPRCSANNKRVRCTLSSSTWPRLTHALCAPFLSRVAAMRGTIDAENIDLSRSRKSYSQVMASEEHTPSPPSFAKPLYRNTCQLRPRFRPPRVGSRLQGRTRRHSSLFAAPPLHPLDKQPRGN